MHELERFAKAVGARVSDPQRRREVGDKVLDHPYIVLTAGVVPQAVDPHKESDEG